MRRSGNYECRQVIVLENNDPQRPSAAKLTTRISLVGNRTLRFFPCGLTKAEGMTYLNKSEEGVLPQGFVSASDMAVLRVSEEA